MKFRIFGFVALAICCNHGYSQQELNKITLSIQQAEKIFLQKNLSLLAEKFNINISEALREQATAWDNPILITDQNLYDGKFFRHRSENGQYYGQVYIQLQQLILTAGKRQKLVKLASSQVESSRALFDDLLRNLRYILVTDLNDLNRMLRSDSVYENESRLLQQLVTGTNEQWKAGNISLKDNVRVKALLFALEADRTDLKQQVEDREKELRSLLQTGDSIFITPAIQATTARFDSLPSLQAAIDSCLQNRPDIRQSAIQLQADKQQLDYQRSLRYPDITVGPEYDRSNSYVPNYWGLAVSFPIPVFNRNKGNIKATSWSINQASLYHMQVQQQAMNEVTTAYRKLQNAIHGQMLTEDEISRQYDTLMQNMTRSYQERRVNLLEFIDFFNAYKESRIKSFELQAGLLNAVAELNFSSGSNLIKIQ